MKRRFKRTEVGHHIARITRTDGNEELAKLNVWVVWCKMDPVTETRSVHQPDPPNIADLTQATSPIQRTVRRILAYRAIMNPSGITNLGTEVPDLNGTPAVHAPNYTDRACNVPPCYVGADAYIGGATYKWDMTRRCRELDLDKNIKGSYLTYAEGERLDTGVPNQQAAVQQKTSLAMETDGYPANPLEGSDDSQSDQNRYDPKQLGEMRDDDRPTLNIEDAGEKPGDTVEQRANFREFVRVELGGAWYIVSEYLPWRLDNIFVKVTKQSIAREKPDNGEYNGIWTVPYIEEIPNNNEGY